MNAQELRLENYVWDNYSGNMIVKQINDNEVSLQNINVEFKAIGAYNINNVQPILITEGWLLMLGFKKRLLNGIISELYIDCTPPNYKNNYRLAIRFNEYGDDKKNLHWYPKSVSGNSHSFPCKYVHQLQNLFHAITNKELTKTK